jgi:hypothetical protein
MAGAADTCQPLLNVRCSCARAAVAVMSTNEACAVVRPATWSCTISSLMPEGVGI